jgi:hypothetical protein
VSGADSFGETIPRISQPFDLVEGFSDVFSADNEWDWSVQHCL